MHPPRMQFTIRSMSVAVALIAVALFILNGIRSGALDGLLDPRGWALSRFLTAGQAVVILADANAPVFPGKVPASRQDFHDFKQTQAVTCHIVKGNFAVIAFDPGDDDDAASRLIAIKLVGGRNDGSVVAVPRGLIRTR